MTGIRKLNVTSKQRKVQQTIYFPTSYKNKLSENVKKEYQTLPKQLQYCQSQKTKQNKIQKNNNISNSTPNLCC